MCGISGIVGARFAQPEALERVRLMGRYLHHRGPDGWGEWVSDDAVLGHNRLAILDLKGGTQPMSCAAGSHVIVFNGEIYNFRELRAAILAAGGSLRTDHSDTEAIVEGYRLWGDSVIPRLDGMFACAIWVPGSRQLVLARDRMGIKPLYFGRMQQGGMAFASEPKALVGAGVIDARLNPDALQEYFLWRATASPQTLFAGIDKLAPGSILRFDLASGRSVISSYADAPVPEVEPDLRRAADAVEAAIGRSVESQLVADVEVGTFLSGGVDSSLITALAARSRRVKAFTVSIDGPLDELPYARRVAQHVGADLFAKTVHASDMVGAFDDWSYFNDDPVADPSALALMLLARDVRAHGLKVMLSGEGADELFGGYGGYRRFAAVRMVTSGVGALPAQLASLFGEVGGEYALDPLLPYCGTAHITSAAMRRALLGASAAGASHDAASTRGMSPLRQAMALDQRVRLPNDVLMRTDRATMAASIEARVPMLSNEVLATSWRLPDQALTRVLPGQSKPLLKQLAARVVPPGVIYRRKVGFDLPIADWLCADFRARIDTALTERRLPGLDYSTVAQWRHELESGRWRLAAVLWAWLVLETWYRSWVEQPLPPRAAATGPVCATAEPTGFL